MTVTGYTLEHFPGRVEKTKKASELKPGDIIPFGTMAFEVGTYRDHYMERGEAWVNLGMHWLRGDGAEFRDERGRFHVYAAESRWTVRTKEAV
jgi:hypothetical protein